MEDTLNALKEQNQAQLDTIRLIVELEYQLLINQLKKANPYDH